MQTKETNARCCFVSKSEIRRTYVTGYDAKHSNDYMKQEEIPMTKEEFQKLTQDVVLLDGATGSNLMAAGMPRGICTEAWIMDHREVLQNLQKA